MDQAHSRPPPPVNARILSNPYRIEEDDRAIGLRGVVDAG